VRAVLTSWPSLVKLALAMSFASKTKQLVFKLFIAIAFIMALAGLFSLESSNPFSIGTTKVFAAEAVTCKEGQDEVKDSEGTVVSCKPSADCDQADLNPENCKIVHWVTIAINTLSAVVGIVIVLMVIIGGIQYSAAGDDPQKVQEAKKKVTNALLALLAFIFMYAFLQWVVPGGIF
jgi:hypothetical protein